MRHTLIRTVPDTDEAAPFGGCGHGPAPAAKRGENAPPVFVNGTPVSEAAIAGEAQNHMASSGLEARAAAARALVIRELLLQRAAALGLEPAPQRDARGREEAADESLIRQLLQREAAPRQPTTEECRRVYDSAGAAFATPELYEASHILCAFDEPGAKAWTAAHRKAVAVLRQLEEGADFALLARRYSDCPTANAGGSLGELAKGDLAEELECALLALSPGGVARSPVRSRHGWHVLRLDSHTLAGMLAFETAEASIRAHLAERAMIAASARYVARLAEQADIEGLTLSFGSP